MSPSKQTGYRWARLFIKLVRFLALLCVLAGAVMFWYTLKQGSVAYRRTLYEPNSAISAHLETVRLQYGTAHAILRSKGIAIDASPTNNSSVGGPDYRTSLQLRAVQTVVTELRQDVNRLQNRYSAAFSRPIDSLIDILSEHSRQIRTALTPTNNSPVSREEDVEQSAAPPQVPERVRMYRAVSQDEIDQLHRIKDDLQTYQSQATKDTTRTCLTDGIGALDIYTTVMEAELPVRITTPVVRTSVETQIPVAPKLQLKVDDLIRSLQSHKAAVQSVVLSDWQVAISIDDLLGLIHKELKECMDCELSGEQQLMQMYRSLAEITVMALVAAFLTMVLADFLQAIIDTPDLIRGTNDPKG